MRLSGLSDVPLFTIFQHSNEFCVILRGYPILEKRS
jgi:hypothetical protein